MSLRADGLIRRLAGAARRWCVYRRTVEELSEIPAAALAELRLPRTAIHDFAWHCAGQDVEQDAER
jgi:uncharacterized protein YjiS (DUF1127 family)